MRLTHWWDECDCPSALLVRSSGTLTHAARRIGVSASTLIYWRSHYIRPKYWSRLERAGISAATIAQHNLRFPIFTLPLRDYQRYYYVTRTRVKRRAR